MDFLSGISMTSMNDDKQNDRLNILELKLDLVTEELGYQFVKREIEEEYEGFFGGKKKRMVTKLFFEKL